MLPLYQPTDKYETNIWELTQPIAARADFPNNMQSIFWDRSTDIKSMQYVLQASFKNNNKKYMHKLTSLLIQFCLLDDTRLSNKNML